MNRMSRRFQFSVQRLLVSTGLLCISLGFLSWAIARNGPALPFLYVYFATIFLGAAGTNLAGRPLLGAVVVMLFWAGFMSISAIFNAPWWISRALLLTVILVAAFLGGMATQRHLDKRRFRNASPIDRIIGVRGRDSRDFAGNPHEELTGTADVRSDD
jgi:hypothetical protein